MEGQTHRVGGVVATLGGYLILKEKGMLIEGVTPLLQLAVMYPFGIVGSVASDQDHHTDSAPLKDVVSMSFCRLLHLTTKMRKASRIDKLAPPLSWFDARHRSWQTHSDLALALVLGILIWVMRTSFFTGADAIIFRLIATGFLLGLISHLVLDMLTPGGVHSLLGMSLRKFGVKKAPVKLRLVPKSEFFATSGTWEKIVRRVLWLIAIILLLYIVYTYLPYEVHIGL